MHRKMVKLVNAILGNCTYNPYADVYKAALAEGWIVYEEPYKLYAGSYGRGYVVTPTGLSAAEAF